MLIVTRVFIWEKGKKEPVKWTSDVLMWQFISESAEQEITMPFPFKWHIIKWAARGDTTIYFGVQAPNSAVMLSNECLRTDQSIPDKTITTANCQTWKQYKMDAYEMGNQHFAACNFMWAASGLFYFL